VLRSMSRWARSPFFPIWLATGLLFVASRFVSPGSLTESGILGMVPFAAILAVAALGQTVVIQQRGLDLSVAGMISLTTVLITKYPNGDDSRLLVGLGLVLLACVVTGMISGLAITRFGITPLVATLGVNALLVGTVLALTSGTSTASSPRALASFALGRTFAVPNTALFAIVLIGAVAIVLRTTAIGRRFVAVGANPTAAYTAGIPVQRYLIATYVLASLTYGLAGVLLAGFLGIPGPLPGDNYLLPTIAAVVLGGTSLAGGAGSVVATGVGAVFLTQLVLVVRAMGAPASAQLIIQGGIIALGMGLRLVPWRDLLATRAARPGGPDDTQPATPAHRFGASARREGGEP
jgi:ribose transport system permease protein